MSSPINVRTRADELTHMLRDGGEASEEAISEYCRQRLASFKKPESVVFCTELPRGPMGKVLKRLLKEEYSYPVVVE